MARREEKRWKPKMGFERPCRRVCSSPGNIDNTPADAYQSAQFWATSGGGVRASTPEGSFTECSTRSANCKGSDAARFCAAFPCAETAGLCEPESAMIEGEFALHFPIRTPGVAFGFPSLFLLFDPPHDPPAEYLPSPLTHASFFLRRFPTRPPTRTKCGRR